METLLQDLRFGLRSLLRAPGFAVASILTLALGIAATTVVFSLINLILLRPIPAHEPERLVMLNEETEGGRMSINGYTAMSTARLDAYEDVAGDLTVGMAGMRDVSAALRTDAGAEMVSVLAVTPDYFDVLGVRPMLGRVFSPEADANGETTVVLSQATWIERYAADPSIVGSTIFLDGQPHTVVGVLDDGFRGTSLGARYEIWVPVETYRRLHPSGRGSWEGEDVLITGFARLADDVEVTTLRAALDAAAPNIPFTVGESRVVSATATPMTLIGEDSERGEVISFLAMFFLTALLVLLIAATNVTGMLLARATGRTREVAIRVAVGADRRRIVRQLVTEGVLVFLLGAAGALLLTFWLLDALPGLMPAEMARVFSDIEPDARVLGFGVGLALLAGITFSVVPAVQVSRTELVPALKEGTAGSGTRRMRLRTVFVVSQVAMSFVLLIVAGLFVRTLQETLRGDTGFEPEGVVTAAINPRTQGYDDEAARRLAEEMADRVRAMPGVQDVALTMFPPLGGWTINHGVAPADRAGDEEAEIVADLFIVSPNYFRTMGTPLLSGRDFDSRDVAGGAQVMIVNEALADSLWPGQNPLGRFVLLGDDEQAAVIGVTPNGKYRDMRDDGLPVYYRPVTQSPPERYTLLARTAGEPGALLGSIRGTLAELDPDLALQQPMLLTELIANTVVPQRIAAGMIGSFGLIGLLLAAIGLYGVLSYHVGQRTREIGIRIALGARAAAVVAMIMRHGTRLAFIGIVIGVLAAVAATRFIRAMLVGVSATDGLTFAAVCILLFAVALLASWLPARRATRVDPTIALRAE